MHEVLVNCLFKLAQENVVRLAITIAVDLGHKATKQTKVANLLVIALDKFVYVNML